MGDASASQQPAEISTHPTCPLDALDALDAHVNRSADSPTILAEGPLLTLSQGTHLDHIPEPCAPGDHIHVAAQLATFL